MPDKQLSDEVLKEYENILLEEKRITLEVISDIGLAQKKGSKDGTGDLSSYSIHLADQGTDTIEMEKNAYLGEEQLKKLRAINFSLRKIYEKTYGICEICGIFIPNERLRIIPYARFCVECEAKEQKNKKR